MKSGKHIIWLVPGFAQNESDTTCLPYLQALLRGFKKYYPEITITVFTFQYPFTKGWYNLFDTRVFSAGGKNKKGLVRFKTWKTILSEVKSFIAKNNVDLIQSFWLTECAVIGNFISKKYKLPHFCYQMGQDCLPTNNYLPLFKFSKFKIISLSEFAAAHYKKTTGKTVCAVIPQGMEDDFYAFDTTVERTTDVIGVGSLIKLKQFNVWVEAIAELKKKFPDIRCVICGDGPEHQNILQLIKEKNLEKNISLYGSVSRTQVMQYMNRSKIFLHTSSFESMGYVIQEALFCGCHIVSFEKGYVPNTTQTHLVKNATEIPNTIKGILENYKKGNSVRPATIEHTVQSLVTLYFD